MKELYDLKMSNYFSSARYEILNLLPQYSEKVLEIGCGTGATLGWLKEIGRCKETTGIELMDDYAQIAKMNADRIITADIEEDNISFPDEYFDLILCLDVLEHLKDPWQVLEFIVKNWLIPGGILVVSLPNIRYRTILMDLLIRGHFQYQDIGILDRTHLRFFTKHSAISLIQSAGLDNLQVELHPSAVKGKMAIINALTFGFFRDTFSWQIILTGSKPLMHKASQ